MAFNLRELLNLNNSEKQKKKAPPAQTVVKPKQPLWKQAVDVAADSVFKNVSPVLPSIVKSVKPVNRAIDASKTGFARSITGGVQGASGLYDLVTPGTGTNRLTKGTATVGAEQDKYVKDNRLSQPLYKSGQVGGEIAQFVAPSKIVTGLSNLPKVGRVVQGGQAIKNFGQAENAAQDLSRGARALRAFATPANAINIGTNTLQNSGYRTAQGQDVSPTSLGIDAGTSLAFGGALQGAGALAEKAVGSLSRVTTGLVSKNVPQASQVRARPDELAALKGRLDAEYEITPGGPPRPSELNIIARDKTAAMKRLGIPEDRANELDNIRARLDTVGTSNTPQYTNSNPPKVTTGLVSRVKENLKNPISSLGQKGGNSPDNSPTIRNIYGEDVPNPSYKPGKVDPLDSLRQEARKYKSAEEFVKAQEKIYRADSKPFDPSRVKKSGQWPGTYFAGTKDFANDFSLRGKRQVSEYAVKPGSKVLEFKDIPDNLFAKDLKDWQQQSSRIYKYAKDNGYDAVRSMDDNMELTVVNPDIVKTPKQLTDLYNQANKPSLLDKVKNSKLMQDDAGGYRGGSSASERIAAKAQVGKTDPVKQAKATAQKTEALKKQGKITPKDDGYWSTPIKGEPKAKIPDVKDINGVTPKEGDTIKFSSLLGDSNGKTKTGTSKVTWVEPTIANASGKRIEGYWSGNGRLDNGIPFEVVKPKSTPTSSGARAVLEANGVNISNRAARELVDDTRMQRAMNGALDEPSRKTTQSAAETILQKSNKDNPISSSANTTPDLQINKYVKDYARTLRGIDEQSSVVIMPDGTRASSNSPFYRKVYAETGRKPTLKAWEAEAKRQLDSGRGDSTAVKEYQQLVKDSTDPEVQSLFAQAPGRELTPIQQNKRNAQSLKSEVQEFRDSLTPVKKSGGESNIPVRKITQEGDVVTATNVNPKIKAGEKRYSVDDKTGELIPDKKGATSLFTDGEGKVTGFRVGKEYFSKEQIGDLSDVNGYGSSMATMRRNVERGFGKETGTKVNEFLVDHQQHQATKLVERQLSLKQGLQKQADSLGVNFSGNSKAAKRTSAAIQDFGEGKRSKASLVDEFGSDQAKKIVQADGWFKGQYNSLLTEMNKTLEEFGYPPVPKRKNYYTHFQEPKLWESFGLKMQEIRDLAGPTMQDANPTAARGGISNKMAGQSEFTSPNKAFNRFALQRKGGAYTSDAFKAFETYLRPTLNNIYMTPSIARARVLTRAVAQDADIVGKDANHIIIQTKEWANRLAGKSNRIDRPLIDTKGGQQYLKTAQWVQRKAGANTIVGNLSTAVMQPILLAQTAGKSGYKNTILAAMQEMSTAHGKNAPIRQSEFLRRRYADLSSVTDGKMAKVSDAVGTPLKVVEETAARISWNAAHNDALSQGLKGKQAIKYADVQTEKTLAGRSIGERPELYESKAAAPITMYQLEVNNFWQQFGKEMTKKQAAKTMVAAYGLNLLLQQATGRSVGFNPIDAAIDSYKETQKEEKSGIDKSKDVARRVAGEFVDNAPIVGPAINLAVGNENMKKVFGQSTNVGRFGVGSPLSAIASTTKVKVGDTKIPIPQNLLLPFGGGQVKKTIEGGQALRDGKLTDKDGNTTVDIPRTPANIARGLAFGPSAIPEVKKFYDNTGKKKVDQVYVPNQIKSTAGTQSLNGLTQKQQDMVNTQTSSFNPEQKNKFIDDLRKENKTDRLAEKTKTSAKKTGDKTKTYDNQEQADVATGKKKIATKGNEVYIKAKNKAGYTTKPKNQYEYDNAKSDTDLAIDRAKSKKDVGAWYDAADKKINAIEKYKKSLDKDTDKVKINSLTKAQEDLLDEALKYKGYGDSFTKGKSTGKGGKGGKGKAYQYKLSDVLGTSESISKSLRKLLAEAKI
jgi:hypothetical protein